LDSGNARKYSGAGLGLAICKSYAELMNAELSVTSKEEQGSNFSLEMKDVIVEELDIPHTENLLGQNDGKNGQDTEQQDQETEAINIDETYNIEENDKKYKILVVDDDNDTLFTVGEILQNLGYETIFATNGVECLNNLEISIPDLVLLDIMMPKMDGFETIKKIRSNPKFSDLLVIALTAHAMLDDKYIIEETGFDDLITKPIDNSTIQLKINQALLNNERK